MSVIFIQVPLAGMTVKVTKRKTSTSKVILLTVNKDVEVVVTNESPPAPQPAPPAQPTPPPAPVHPAPHPVPPPPIVPPVAGKPYTNPIHPTQLADPSAVLHAGKTYLVGTDSRNIWIGDALQGPYKSGPIILPQGTWAPEQFVSKKDGLCYTNYSIGAPPHGIGVLVSTAPDAPPFKDLGIIIQNAIDGHFFEDDDGELYLYSVNTTWTTTHAPPGFWIQVTKMTAPTQPVGQQTAVVIPDSAEEIGVNEGASVKRRGAIYYMTYSFANADKVNYSTAYATALGPMGPFSKRGTLMKSGNGIYAPGHGSIVIDSQGNWWFLYYQKLGAAPGWDRRICLDKITFTPSGEMQITPTRGVSMPGPR